MEYTVWFVISVVLLGVSGLIGIALYGIFRAIRGVITKKHAPFIPIPDSAMDLLENMQPPSAGSIVYDIGCGDGKILMYLAKKFPKAIYVGIEYDLLPYIFARINTRTYKNITIRFRDLFKEDFTKTDILVAYLSPYLLDKLLSKLEKELKKGAIFYSFDYGFAKKEAKLTEYNKDASLKRGKRIIRYEF